MFLLGQWLAAPLSAIFVSYDAALLELTVSAYKLYALCFLFMYGMHRCRADNVVEALRADAV